MFKDFIFTMLIIECATWEQLFIQVSYVKLHPCNGVVSLWRSLGMAQSRYGIVLLILLLSFVYFRMEVPLCMLDIVVMMYY